MPNLYFRLNLQPIETLRLIADVIQHIDHNLLQEVVVEVDSYSKVVSLLVPVVHRQAGGQNRDQARLKAFDLLIDRFTTLFPYNRDKGYEQVDTSVPPLSLVSGLIEAVLMSGEQNFVGAQEQEYMLVAQGIDPRRIAAICSDLRFHATHFGFTAASGADPAERVYLFYIRSDQARKSSFPSTLAGEFYTDCAVLQGYESGGILFFFPPGERIDPNALRYLREIVKAAPLLFGGGNPHGEHNLLLAVDSRGNIDSSSTPCIWYLAHLTFQSSVTIEPIRPANRIEYEVVTLSASEANVATLRVRIEEAARRPDEYIGYRLELRPTRFQEPGEAQYEKLQNQIIRLEYQLAYLDSIATPRPTLLQFSQRQLPALADVLRTFPMKVLQNGDLLYGFHSNRQNPEGIHYLFIHPDVVMTEASPISRWGHLESARPMHFWIDPFWGKYYHQSPNRTLVFVPKGTALFPFLHGWDIEDMDTYLRDMIGRWFHGRPGIQSLPDEPLYLFEGLPNPDAIIKISVLDFAKFKPLRGFELGWLNDNLLPMNELGIEDFISQMASDITRRQMNDAITISADEATRIFQQTANRTRNEIAHHTNDLTSTVTRELAELVDETTKVAAQLQSLDQTLLQLRSLHSEMSNVAERANQAVTQTEQQVEATEKDTTNLIARAQQVIGLADNTRKEIHQQIETCVRSLEKTRQQLIDRINRL